MTLRSEEIVSGDLALESTAHLTILRQAESAGERMSTTLDGTTTVWRRWGSGPPLVLLHGGYGSWRHWIQTIPAFASHRTLFVPDMPGLGDSDEVPAPVTPERIAAHVCHGVDQLIGAHTPFDLVGFSFGSTIAGLAAARLGSRVDNLVLVGPGALGLPIQRIDLLTLDASMSQEDVRDVLRTNLSRLMLAQPHHIDDLALSIQFENTKRARVKSRRIAVTDTLAQALTRVSPRHLAVIWGALDAVAYGYFAERTAYFSSIRDDVEIHLIPGAGHWVAYDAPEYFNRVLAQCLGHPAAEA